MIMKKTKTQSLICNVHINDYSIFRGDIWLPANKVYTLIIDYPIRNKVKVKIKTGKKGLGFNGLIGRILKEYCKIYKDADSENKYGVWGHSMEDLAIEGIRVDHVKKIIDLCIGS